MDRWAEAGQFGREQLEKILASQTFQGAVRSQTLLRFLVEAALENRADRLKDTRSVRRHSAGATHSIRAPIPSSGPKPRG